LDVLTVEIDEVRVRRRRRPGFVVVDRRLRGIVAVIPLLGAGDLWNLLPGGLPDPFTALDLARALDRPVGFARRVAYCLREAGAARAVGKVANRVVYRIEGTPANPR
jgi:hypothetical protein